jgi:radical SAM protein with 4Fe4S-binding SPASM domain
VAQCDCWVTSYPQFRFGNILESSDLNGLLDSSSSRRDFEARPATLVQEEDCIDCDYLALCHGGCPVRAYSVWGNLFAKDPYCEVYKAIFRRTEKASMELAAKRSRAISASQE